MGNIQLSRQGFFNPKQEPRLSPGSRQPFFSNFRVKHPGWFREMENVVHQQVRFILFCPPKCLTSMEMVLAVMGGIRSIISKRALDGIIKWNSL